MADRNPFWPAKKFMETPMLTSERIAADIAVWEAKGNRIQQLRPGEVSEYNPEEKKSRGTAAAKQKTRLDKIKAAAAAAKAEEETVSLDTLQEEEVNAE
jgi:RPA family protein